MNKRKIFVVSVVMLAVFALCGQTLAISTNEDNISEIAGMSLDSADPEMREKILEARKEIIFNKSWAADGVDAYVIDCDGTYEKIPAFSEVFPGWEIPKMENNSGAEDDYEMIADEDSPEIMPLSEDSASFRVYLKNPSTEANTTPFAHTLHEGSYVTAKVSTLYSSEHCNLGFSDYSTGDSLAYKERLYPGQSIVMNTLGWDSFECGVRASTHSTPGWSIIMVTHDLPNPAIR